MLYVLRAKGLYYIGYVDNDIERRVQQHCVGDGCVFFRENLKYGDHVELLSTCEGGKREETQLTLALMHVTNTPNNVRGGVFCQSRCMSMHDFNSHLEKYEVLQDDDLISFARRVVSRNEYITLEKEEECSICLESMKHAVELKQCKHKFHYECLHRLRSTSSRATASYGSYCPLCRTRGTKIAKKLFTYTGGRRKTIGDLYDDETILVSSRMSPCTAKIHRYVCGNFKDPKKGFVKDLKCIFTNNILCKKCFNY